MSGFKKNGALLPVVAAGEGAAMLSLMFALGTLLRQKEWLAAEGMNIFIKIAVFLCVLFVGKTISRGRKGNTLLSYAISALALCCILTIVAFVLEWGSVKALVLLENFVVGILASLFGAFVQIRQNHRRKMRRRIR